MFGRHRPITAAELGVMATPSDAYSMARLNSFLRSSRPYSACMAIQPPMLPGTSGASGPVSTFVPLYRFGSAASGALPEKFRTRVRPSLAM